MATILDLTRAKTLSKFLPELAPHQQEFRLLYAAPRFENWVLQKLPNLASNWNLELTPAEQLDDYLSNYALGRPLTFGRHFNPIRHVQDGVWELKTADLRVFGWFYRIDQFIALVGDETWRVKEYNLYSGYAGEVAQFRESLDLDGPKFIPGKDPKNVISNFTTAP